MASSKRSRQIPVLYKEGKTIEEIADILGYKKTEFVRATLKDHCLLKEPPEIGVDVPKVLALQKAGWDMAEIIREFNRMYTAEEIMEAVNKYGKQNERRPY